MFKFSALAKAAVVAAALCVSLSAHASGGAYLDDLILRNEGAIVYSDNFDSGILSGWHSAKDVSLSTDRSYSGAYSLYANWHDGPYATIVRDISVADPGLMELAFRLWMPHGSQQWNGGGGAHITNLYIVLYSSSTGKHYEAGLWLYPYESEYRLYLNGGYERYGSVHSGFWHDVSVRLDPYYVSPHGTQGQGVILLNGYQKLLAPYPVADFPTIDRITIWSTFGDKQPVPEPASLVVLTAGVLISSLRLGARRIRV